MAFTIQQPQQAITEQEYPADELSSTIKHEYINGTVFSMAEATANHNRICNELTRFLANHLDDYPL